MPRPAKGARLYLRPEERGRSGEITRQATWVIRDGERQVGTGCAPDEAGAAEQALADYIKAKYTPPRRGRHPSQVPLADVLSIYYDDCGPPEPDARKRFAGRIKRLSLYWGEKTLDEVDAASCRAYVGSRGSSGGARRDLEDLRAAINHHARQRLHEGAVFVALPGKGQPRDRWLTRSEAAQLLWTCWRTREMQSVRHDGSSDGPKAPTTKYPLRHLARFILIGLYTGTRSASIASASWYAAAGKSYLDLDAGLFYRHRTGARQTNKRQPPAPLPPRLLAHLRRWKERGICAAHPVEWNGQPVTSVKTAFRSAVLKAGLDGRVTPHTLRHTAATWLMQSGISIWNAAGYVGMSTTMMERTYGHQHPDYLREAAAAIGNKRATGTEMVRKRREQTVSEAVEIG